MNETDDEMYGVHYIYFFVELLRFMGNDLWKIMVSTVIFSGSGIVKLKSEL